MFIEHPKLENELYHICPIRVNQEVSKEPQLDINSPFSSEF